MAISQRLRYEILRRDGHRCRYCGASAQDSQLTVDHVRPVALGGTDDPTNLVTACQPCNSGKSSTEPDAPLLADVAAADLEWRARVASALEAVRAQHAEISAAVDCVGEAWDSWTWTDRKGQRHHFAKGNGWRASVRLMLDRGLSVADLEACIEIAMEAHPDDEWSYFCGVAWNTLRRAQEG